MYYCQDCKKNFEFAQVVFERHGLENPPFERILRCPFCHSDRFKELVSSHCKYCGSRLSIEGDYCSDYCKRLGEKMWERQRNLAELKKRSLLEVTLKELDSYNKAHNTRLSYGQYIVIKERDMKNGQK